MVFLIITTCVVNSPVVDKGGRAGVRAGRPTAVRACVRACVGYTSTVPQAPDLPCICRTLVLPRSHVANVTQILLVKIFIKVRDLQKAAVLPPFDHTSTPRIYCCTNHFTSSFSPSKQLIKTINRGVQIDMHGVVNW